MINTQPNRHTTISLLPFVAESHLNIGSECCVPRIQDTPSTAKKLELDQPLVCSQAGYQLCCYWENRQQGYASAVVLRGMVSNEGNGL